MRKLSLKTYSSYSLKKMSKQHTLSLSKLYQEYRDSNVRLYAPLLSWCYLNELQLQDNTFLKYHLEKLRMKSNGPNESVLLDYLKNSDDLELNKYAYSFESENMRRDETELKNRYRNVFKQFQKQLGLSTYKLCQMAGANSGNFDLFYNKNQNDKLSSKKCKVLLEKLTKMV